MADFNDWQPDTKLKWRYGGIKGRRMENLNSLDISKSDDERK